MLDEAEYASDTDESDEDYKPGGDASDVASEVESDGEVENDDDNEAATKRGGRKRPAAKETPVDSKRTRQSTASDTKATEKDTLEADDDDVDDDALWASFLSNTGQTASKAADSKPNPQSTTITSTSNGNSKAPEKPKSQKPAVSTEQKKFTTEIFEFAGEKVEVQKEVTASEEKKEQSSEVSNSSKASATASNSAKASPIASFNRRSGGSGLNSVLGQIGKKNKLSILEKTKLDWSGFKRNEGIDEELQTHNKGRDGYLERQDFLQRTDLRQFEIEKNMRQANRRK